jgi:hypothetical protein
MVQQGPRLHTDPTVQEGGVIVVHAGAGVDEVTFKPAGEAATRVRVVNGRAEYRLPPNVRGGATVLISDMQFPNPTSTEVLVVGND